MPLSVDTKLHEVDGAMNLPEEYQFGALIGSFMRLATQTRPDIAKVRAVGRYC